MRALQFIFSNKRNLQQKKMNLSVSNQQHQFEGKKGTLSVMGNSNQIILTKCQVQVNVMGNGNTFIFEDCIVLLQINGNGNVLEAYSSQLSIGVNGNGNELNSSESSVSLTSCNGFGNNISSNSSQSHNCFSPNWGSNMFGQEAQSQYCFQNSSHNNPQFIPNQRIRGTQENFNNSRSSNNSYQNQNPFRASNNQMQINQSHQNQNPFRASSNQTQINQNSLNRRIPENGRRQQNRNRPNQYRNAYYGNEGSFHNAINLENNSMQNDHHSLFGQRNYERRRPQTISLIEDEENPSLNGFRRNPGQYRFNLEDEPISDGLSLSEIQMLPKSKYSGGTDKCSICLDQIMAGSEVTYLLCFHLFHSSCSSDWLKKSPNCPLCQANMRQQILAHKQ